MNAYLFVFLNFMVGFVSDIILNFLSTKEGSKYFKSRIIQSLRPYFDKRSVLRAALDAGITIVVVLLFVMLVSKLIFGFAVPNNIIQLNFFSVIAFFAGFAADKFIDDYKIFGNDLDPYYQEAGVGLWGALALTFAIIISYMKQKFLIKYII